MGKVTRFACGNCEALALASRGRLRTLAAVVPPAAFSMLRIWAVILFGGLASLCGQTASPFVSGAWCGNVTPTSATVKIRLDTAGLRVRLVVSTNDRLTPAVFSVAQTTAAASG